MSASTLPKSVQEGDTVEEATSSQDRTQFYRDFINRIKHLPDDFLRIPLPYYQQEHSAIQQTRPIVSRDVPLVDTIDISVVEAQLVKNYGLLRMDLYCKIRVGHMVCETQTCVNGAKNPKWDGVYQFSLKPGIGSFHLEIYDEKQFSLDEKVAWLYEPIPLEVFQGITVERWFPLSGRLGPGKEGSILLVLSHKRVPMRTSNFNRAAIARHGSPFTVFVPPANQSNVIGAPTTVHQIPTHIQPMPIGVQPQIPDVQNPRPITEEEINQLSEMFPSIDKVVIRAVLENNHNDKEATIGELLSLG